MRRALVTGGTKGLGLAIARALAARGDEIVALYASDHAAAEAAEAAFARDGHSFAARKCDVASAADVDALFAVEGERGFDLLVHAAGFTRDKLMLMMPERDFDDVVAAHLKGGFLVAKQALKAMIAKKAGRVVFIVSPTALLGRVGQTNYGAAKAGLIGLTRSLAREVARFPYHRELRVCGIRRNRDDRGAAGKGARRAVAGDSARPRRAAGGDCAAAEWLCSDGARLRHRHGARG